MYGVFFLQLTVLSTHQTIFRIVLPLLIIAVNFFAVVIYHNVWCRDHDCIAGMLLLLPLNTLLLLLPLAARRILFQNF